MSLFTNHEKGSREWSAFNSVRDDRAGAYRVLTPKQAQWPRYDNSVPTHRYPRRLTLKVTH